jgi:hypothetical protein
METPIPSAEAIVGTQRGLRSDHEMTQKVTRPRAGAPPAPGKERFMADLAAEADGV